MFLSFVVKCTKQNSTSKLCLSLLATKLLIHVVSDEWEMEPSDLTPENMCGHFKHNLD